MEEQKAYSEYYLLREIKTLKGLLQQPQAIYLHKPCQLMLVQCDVHLYIVSLLNMLRGTKQLVLHLAPSDMYKYATLS